MKYLGSHSFYPSPLIFQSWVSPNPDPGGLTGLKKKKGEREEKTTD